MRPIENVDLRKVNVPEVTTDGKVKVVREKEDGEIEILDNRTDFLPVVNEERKEAISINTGQYKLYPNEEFVDVVKAVTGEQFEGYINKSWNRLDIYYWPEEYRIDVEPSQGDIIKMGLRFTNSYDGSTALRTQFVGHRLVCKNGISAKGLISGVSTTHTTDSLDGEEFQEIVEQLYADTDFELLRNIFEDAKDQRIDDPVEWIEALAWNNNLPDSIKSAIQTELVKNNVDSISRYNLWNMFTEKLTHGHGNTHKNAHTYSESYLQRCHKKINEILTVSEGLIQDTMDDIRELEEVQERYNEMDIEVVAEP